MTQTSQEHLLLSIASLLNKNFPIILADEGRIEQVMSNLISNSIKYAPNGEIRVNGQVDPERVIICVSDEGAGIAPEDIFAEVLGPFISRPISRTT